MRLLSCCGRRLSLVAFATLLCFAPGCGHTPTEPKAPHYAVILLGTLGGRSKAMDINDHGTVVGYAQTDSGLDHAVMWTGGQTIDLGTLGLWSFAYAVNNHDEVVGDSRASSDGHTHAVLWRDGTIVDLGGVEGYETTWAYDINDSDQIIGSSYHDPSGRDPGHTVMWKDSVLSDLGSEMFLFSLNSEGTAVGCFHLGYDAGAFPCGGGVVWRDGKEALSGPPPLPAPPGGWLDIIAINDDGIVLAVSAVEPYPVFLWDGHRATQLESPWKRDIEPTALSPSGRRVVGIRTDRYTGRSAAFLWENGRWTDLGALAETALGEDIAANSWARAINRRGQIVGYVWTVPGEEHAVLWDPR